MTQDAEQNALLALLSEEHGGVLVTLKRDGRPQLSNVMHAYYPDERVIRVSLTDDRAKTRNLRRDPRASYHVTTPDRWAYTVAEGTAALSPVARDPYDETVEELIRLYRDINGEHPDWNEYRAAMVRDKRLVLRLRVAAQAPTYSARCSPVRVERAATSSAGVPSKTTRPPS